MTKTFTFTITPGHGYLKVSAKFLLETFPEHIEKITSYSYISKDFKNFYLEEDEDASNFKELFEGKGHTMKIKSVIVDYNFGEDFESTNSKIREWSQGNSSYTNYLKIVNS